MKHEDRKAILAELDDIALRRQEHIDYAHADFGWIGHRLRDCLDALDEAEKEFEILDYQYSETVNTVIPMLDKRIAELEGELVGRGHKP